MTKKPKTRKQIIPKECVIHVSIHLRDYGHFGENGPRYCVEAECQKHKSTWQGLTDDFETAKLMAHDFPLVNGGITYGDEGFQIPHECLFSRFTRRNLD